MEKCFDCQTTDSKDSNEPKLPVFKTAIDSRFSTHKIFQLFQDSCVKCKFYLSEVTPHSITAASSRTSLFSFCKCWTDNEPQVVSVVKLQVAVYHPSTLKLVVAKGIEGARKEALAVIKDFKSSFEKWLKGHGRVRSMTAKRESLVVRKVDLLSYSDFTRIMADEDTEVGRVLADFADKWMLGFPDDPLAKVKVLIFQILKGMLVYHSSDCPKIHQYYKPFAEKYAFYRYMKDLLSFYSSNVSNLQQRFQAKVTMLRELDKHELLRKIGVRDLFILERAKFPYEQSVKCLNNMQVFMTPIKKLSCLIEMITLLKITVLDYWRGKVELQNMDDQFPLIVYLVCLSDDLNLIAQIVLLRDYLLNSHGLDYEVLIVTTIESCISYITDIFEL